MDIYLALRFSTMTGVPDSSSGDVACKGLSAIFEQFDLSAPSNDEMAGSNLCMSSSIARIPQVPFS